MPFVSFCVNDHNRKSWVIGGVIPVHCCLWSALGGRHVNYAVWSVLSMIVDCFWDPNSSVFLIDQHWAFISFDSRGSFLRWNWIRKFFKNRIAHSVEKMKTKIIFFKQECYFVISKIWISEVFVSGTELSVKALV